MRCYPTAFVLMSLLSACRDGDDEFGAWRDSAADTGARDDAALRPGDTQTVTISSDGGRVIVAPYVEVDGMAVVGGDVVLGRVEDLRVPGAPPTAGISATSSMWPDCEVPYELDSSVDAATETIIRAAIAEWTANTDFVFTEDAADPQRVVFSLVGTSAGVCLAYGLGIQSGTLAIELESGCSTGNTIHEIGHAIGMYHEQTRVDRDSSVQVIWANIDPSHTDQFQKYTDIGRTGDDYGSYDFDSIMQYSSAAFTTGTCTTTDLSGCTLLHLDGTYITEYQRSALSAGDIAGVDDMYSPMACGCDAIVYDDADGDGYGDASTAIETCSAPSTYTVVTNSDDCDDDDASIFPGATETCNSEDDDCDGTVDEGVGTYFYTDTDGDGWGDSSTAVEACTAPTNGVARAGDCDETNSAIHPSAPEACNSTDDDCDGTVDEGIATTTWYPDADADGWGDNVSNATSCVAPSQSVDRTGDCDETNASIHPGAAEVCNQTDDDCDGEEDEDLDLTWFLDDDGDGFGDPGTTAVACAEPVGYVSRTDDCDDTTASIHPGAEETCNEVDDDCDGTIDDGVPTYTWYADADADGWGDTTRALVACEQPAEYVERLGDCDELDAGVHPGATELCNVVDDDCDGEVDEGLELLWHPDSDGDGFGDPDEEALACAAPAGWVADGRDCDDATSDTHPGADELENGVDSNCDGVVTGGVLPTDSCGCTASAPLTSAIPVGLVALLGVARRRRAPAWYGRRHR